MNTTRTYRVLSFAAIAMVAWMSALLFPQNVFADGAKSSLNSADESFVKQAGQMSKDEMKIAELGTQKAERTDVKGLAEMLMKDRTAMNTDLSQLAETKHVPLSAVISPASAQKFKNLEKYFGIDFDRAFVGMMEGAQQSAISMFEKAEKKVADADLKVWFSRNLASLRLNLDQIKDLKSKLPPDTTIDTTTPPFLR
jgi:predicted outer membrane protein